jgi:hypothetical protein
MANVAVDVTLRIGRLESVRAVAQVNPDGAGVYCVRVSLPLAGEWKLTFRYVDRGRSGKVSVFAPVS